MKTIAPTGTPRSQPARTADGDDGGPHPGRTWHLLQGGTEVGTFTDLRRRNFNPGERLIDDQGNRRIVIAILDGTALRLGVSAALH